MFFFPKYIKDFFASEKRNLFHTYWDSHCEVLSFVSLIGLTMYFTVVRVLLHSVNLSMCEINIYLAKCLNDFHSRVAIHQKTHFDSYQRFLITQTDSKKTSRLTCLKYTWKHGSLNAKPVLQWIIRLGRFQTKR